jgi:hypothetical protein
LWREHSNTARPVARASRNGRRIVQN